MIYRLENTIRKYAWGSRTFIPGLLGEKVPAADPWAELWIGAHPQAPSRADDGGRLIPLNELIRRDPAGMLGERAAKRFNGTLPFLCKVLAADVPLSIQAHPDERQSRAGFQRENQAGIPPDDPERNYRDPNHKQELLCALTPFHSLCGFRPLLEIAALLSSLDLGAFLPGGEAFLDDPSEHRLRSLFRTLLFLSGQKRELLLSTLLDRARAADSRCGSGGPALRWIARIAERYPKDIGVAAPLFLNIIDLEPGEALFVRAGVLHSYLEGAGVEIMSSSDNVLRGGLTAKHVDGAELLAILSFSAKAVRPRKPETGNGIEFVYRTPAPEFQLSRISTTTAGSFTAGDRNGAEILLCVGGGCLITGKGALTIGVKRGESVFIPYGVGDFSIRGEAVLYRAALPPG
ncbi:MAG: mannose-6-phosphate isomerase, class I [PVC group bacterium]